MKRYALFLALISFGFGSLAMAPSAGAASADAKKHCTEQWNAEQKAKSIPRGMSRAKYMKECTANYTANKAASSADQSNGASTAWPPTDPQSPPAAAH